MKIEKVHSLFLPQKTDNNISYAYKTKVMTDRDTFEHKSNNPSFKAAPSPINSKLYWSLIAQGIVAVAGVIYKQLSDSGVKEENINPKDLIEALQSSIQDITGNIVNNDTKVEIQENEPLQETNSEFVETEKNNTSPNIVIKTVELKDAKQEAPCRKEIKEAKERKSYERRTKEKDELVLEMKLNKTKIEDICKATGYSKATIRRVLNSNPNFETRSDKKIKEQYKKLNYAELTSKLNEFFNIEQIYKNNFFSSLILEFVEAEQNNENKIYLEKLCFILEKVSKNEIKLQEAEERCKQDNIKPHVEITPVVKSEQNRENRINNLCKKAMKIAEKIDDKQIRDNIEEIYAPEHLKTLSDNKIEELELKLERFKLFTKKKTKKPHKAKEASPKEDIGEKNKAIQDFFRGKIKLDDKLKNYIKSYVNNSQDSQKEVTIEEVLTVMEIIDNYNELSGEDKSSISKILELFKNSKSDIEKALLQEIVKQNYNNVPTIVYNESYGRNVVINAEVKQILWKKFKSVAILKQIENAARKKATKSGTDGIKFLGQENNNPEHSMEIKIKGANGYIRIFSEFDRDENGNCIKKDPKSGNLIRNFTFTKVFCK